MPRGTRRSPRRVAPTPVSGGSAPRAGRRAALPSPSGVQAPPNLASLPVPAVSDTRPAPGKIWISFKLFTIFTILIAGLGIKRVPRRSRAERLHARAQYHAGLSARFLALQQGITAAVALLEGMAPVMGEVAAMTWELGILDEEDADRLDEDGDDE